MRVIQKQAKAARDILGKQKISSDRKLRLLTYAVTAVCEEGTLIFNVLTKELLLIEDSDEREDIVKYLTDNWFLVPEDNDDKELCLSLRAVAQRMNSLNSPKGFMHYTILTTTDCNARCFYCYEAGTKRQNMSRETALKTADFICKNYESVKRTSRHDAKIGKVTLQWFGGEPLYNLEVIDLITDELKKRDVPFRSSMVTNGYLFDDEVVKKAVDRWNLRHLQITLDGTEEVYNRSKAYIYKDGNPYLRVIDNIRRILDAGISVSIRLNLSDENYEDLDKLIDQLIDRFSGYEKLKTYATFVFKINENASNVPFSGDTETICRQMIKLDDKIRSTGMMARNKLRKSVKINNCMADNDSTVLIHADGTLGRCEHYYDSFSCGDIENGVTDEKAYSYWKQLDEDSEACNECPGYPDCIRLKGCNSASLAACQQFEFMRDDIVPSFQQDMLKCYYKAKMI